MWLSYYLKNDIILILFFLCNILILKYVLLVMLIPCGNPLFFFHILLIPQIQCTHLLSWYKYEISTNIFSLLFSVHNLIYLIFHIYHNLFVNTKLVLRPITVLLDVICKLIWMLFQTKKNSSEWPIHIKSREPMYKKLRLKLFILERNL